MNVSLSAGLSGSYATRKMFSGVNILNYNIFWSTAYNQIMGDGSGGSFAGSAGPFPWPPEAAMCRPEPCMDSFLPHRMWRLAVTAT